MLAFRGAAGGPDGQLVADADCLVAAGGAGGHGDDVAHAGGDADVRLTPRRAEGVIEVPPVRRVAQGPRSWAEGGSLEGVGGLDQPLIEHDLEAELGGQRCGGLHCAIQRRGHQHDHVPASQEARRRLGHQAAVLGQMEAGDAAIEDALRVVDLSVPEQVHDRGGAGRRGIAGGAVRGISHGQPSLPAFFPALPRPAPRSPAPAGAGDKGGQVCEVGW